MTDAHPDTDVGDNGTGRVPLTISDNLPATLADIEGARLPATYEAAQKAIEECERVDECKTWADKAAALASYARQAKNDNLRVMAVRIQDRAQRRCGELLKQIPRGDQATRFGQAGTHPPAGTRIQAAADAGLSPHQAKQSVRIANIPAPEFEAAVESASPLTVTALANRGKTNPRAAPRSALPKGVAEAYDALAAFVRFCERTDPAAIARAIDVQDVEAMRHRVAAADRWLDRFVTGLSLGD
jgi:hypothetical protein